MSATTAGAIKAWVEAGGLGVAAYRDGAPTDDSGAITAPYPHVVIQEGLDYGVDAGGDTGDQAAERTITELVQVDLFQYARTLVAGGSQNAESYTLHGALVARLHGARIPAVGAQAVYGVLVRGGRRWPISDNVVRHTIDLAVKRTLNRS